MLWLKGEPRGPKGDAEMGPTQRHGGTAQERRNTWQEGDHAGESEPRDLRGKGYKIERDLLIWDHSGYEHFF